LSDDDRFHNGMALELLEEQADATIRRAEIEGVWYFSVVDILAILTDSTRPRKYWSDLKASMSSMEGWSELSANIGQLKLASSDGKYYLTDAADAQTILRIIQSVPSPKVEPIKQWLAKVGAEKLKHPPTTLPPPSDPDTPALHQSAIAVAWTEDKPADGDLLGWAAWLEKLALVYRQQAALESRVSYMEAGLRSHDQRLEDITLRLVRLEEGQSTLPDLLALLHSEELSRPHQAAVRRWVGSLAGLTGWHQSMIYQDLLADFAYEKFSDASETDWQRIEEWFQARLESARKRR
jgi:hypothetical protein